MPIHFSCEIEAHSFAFRLKSEEEKGTRLENKTGFTKHLSAAEESLA